MTKNGSFGHKIKVKIIALLRFVGNYYCNKSPCRNTLENVDMDQVTAQSFLRNVDFDTVSTEEKLTFTKAIIGFKERDLENLLQFVTGSRDLSLLGRSKIQVEVRDQSGVFASSCTFKLVLPKSSFCTIDALNEVLLAASNQSDIFNAP